MLRPDFRNFHGVTSLVHSAKGSTWEDHKYIKRVNGTYYYPDNYEGGRHISDLEGKDKSDVDAEDMKKILEGISDWGGWEKYQELMKSNDYAKGGDPISNFRLFMGEFGGIDDSKYSDSQIKTMMSELEDRKSARTLSKDDVEKLAMETIRGNFENGQKRKELLGENYAEVQKRVNEILKGSSGSQKVSEVSDSDKKAAEEAAKKASAPTKSDFDMSIYEVYEEQRKRGDRK